jgi:hypothetical protein
VLRPLVVLCALSSAAAADPALSWSEFDASAPSSIALAPWTKTADVEACPPDFDASALLARCVSPACFGGRLDRSTRVAMVVTDPAGSGHFEAVGIAVGTPRAPRFACLLASTVGWRALSAADQAHSLSPLPWLADLDGDGFVEVIVWQRLPWGSSEYANGLAPAIYSGASLVRADARGRSLATRVARAYRTGAASRDIDADDAAAFRALAAALSHWGTR